MNEKQSIGNVNILDIRRATPESILGIEGIGNVNVLLHTRETAPLITQLNIGNANATIEIPADVNVKPFVGMTNFNHHTFKNTEPVFMMAIGQTIFEPDVEEKDILSGVQGLVMIGQVIYPITLSGAIQSKTQQMIGETLTYPAFERVKFNSQTIDQNYLTGLPDHTELAVIGNVNLFKVLPNELLTQKISKLYTSGNITCHEENLAALQACLVEGYKQLKIIPEGFELIGKSFTIDNDVLETLPARKLFCTEPVTIAASVDPTLFDSSLDAIQGKEKILCPTNLRRVMASKCSLIDNQVIFYEGTLLVVEDTQTLRASRLNAMKEPLTILVSGELTLAPDVTESVLENRLAKVHNLGMISCSPEQRAIIENHLGISEGAFVDNSPNEEKAEVTEEEGTKHIGNVNYMTL